MMICRLVLCAATAATLPSRAAEPAPSPSPAAGPTPATVTHREEVVVTAARMETRLVETPASASVRDMEELQAAGFYAGGDELRGEPGFYFRRGEGDNDDFMFVNVRGITGNHGNDTFLALVDGIPFVYPNEEVYLNHLPYAAVGTIELVRGPVSALYGRGGVAGAINYLTRVPVDRRSEVRLFAGSDALVGGELALTRSVGERTRLLLSGSGLHAHGWREHNERRSASVFAKSVSQVGSGSILTLWANWLDKRYETGSPIPTYADGERVAVGGGRTAFIGSRDTFNDTSMLFAAGRLDHRIDERWSLQGTLHARRSETRNELDFYDSFGFQPARNVVTWNGFGSSQKAATTFAELQASRRGDRTRLLAGANWERGALDQEDRWTGQNGFTFECGFAFYAIEVDWTTGRVVNEDQPCFVRSELRSVTDSTNTYASGFAQAEIDLHGRVQLTLGARYDHFRRESAQQNGAPLVTYPLQDGAEGNFSPKLALRVRVADGTFAYATYGEGFNSNFGPIWQWDPGLYKRVGVKPTTLDSLEVGIKGQPGPRLTYALSGFAIRQHNRPVYLANPDAADDFTQPGTLVTTGQLYESLGLEASVRADLGGRTRAHVKYGYTRAEWKDYVLETAAGDVDLSGRAPTGVPAHLVAAGLEQDLGRGVTARAWWEAYADYFVTQDNRHQGGGYSLLNASLSWRPASGRIAGITLAATNLLDDEYYYYFGSRDRVLDAVPGVPFQARLTLDLRF